MTEPAAANRRRRTAEPLQRDDYFRVALGLLAEGGSKLVTIANVCDALHVTKGAFYYQFESGPHFLRELLLWWEEEYSGRLITQALDVPDPGVRLLMLCQLASEFEHEAESALRALARTDEFAAEMQRRVDAARTEVVSRTLRDLGFGRADADRFAQMSVSLLVGAQQVLHPPDPKQIGKLLDRFRLMILEELPDAGS